MKETATERISIVIIIVVVATHLEKILAHNTSCFEYVVAARRVHMHIIRRTQRHALVGRVAFVYRCVCVHVHINLTCKKTSKISFPPKLFVVRYNSRCSI